MADTVALMRAASDTGKLADKMRGMWEERTKLRADSNNQAWELILRAQIDEIFLVLAHLGEALLPLGVFNKDYYLQTLGEVKASLASCGNDLLVMAWEELDAELQYTCVTGFTFCAHFSPMPVYRGFGACVLSDWDWGCPDTAYLEEKARKKAIRTVYGIKQKTDPQPTRPIFEAFDQAIQILQVKSMAFFVKRPPLSGFSEQPRFGGRPKKEVKNDMDLLEDWLRQIIRRSHPSPAGQRITNWGIPYATWTSEANCLVLKSERDYEPLMLNQMDPGRLLHAFVCRRAASLDEHSMLLLLPRSAAESLIVWLEGLPGMNHRIVRWDDLDTETFEKKISKSLRKKIGHHPIPLKYAVKHPNASVRPDLHVSESSPAVLETPNTVSPPPYSPPTGPAAQSANAPPAELPQRERAATVPVAELGDREPQELPEDGIVEAPTQPLETAVKQRSSTLGLKSIHDLRRKPSDMGSATVASTTAMATATTRHPTVLRPGATKGHSSTNWMIEDGTTWTTESQNEPDVTSGEPAAVELPAEIAAPLRPVRKPVPSVPSVTVQSPSDSGDLPITQAETTDQDASNAPKGEPQPTSSSSFSEPAAASTGDNAYLELLNKVARGEISPQALSEMLQSGTVGYSTSLAQSSSDPATATSESTGTVAQKPPARPLPYPDSPKDGKQS